MSLFRPKRVVDLEPESVAAAIIRLEALTDRIQATAAKLEQLVAQLREEEAEEVRNG